MRVSLKRDTTKEDIKNYIIESPTIDFAICTYSFLQYNLFVIIESALVERRVQVQVQEHIPNGLT